MFKRSLEARLAAMLREREAGRGADEQSRHDPGSDLSRIAALHARLESSSPLLPPEAAKVRGRQRMLSALAAQPARAGGLQMIQSLFAMVPKAALIALGGVVLTGGAMGASAAMGGPNVPVMALSAVGVHVNDHAADHSTGIDSSNASESGKGHASPKAKLGSANADATATAAATGTATSGIGHSKASDNGLDHASPNAFLGAANADGHGQVTATAEADDDHEALNATTSDDNEATVDADGIGDEHTQATVTVTVTPSIITGMDHSGGRASEGVENTGTHSH